MGRKRLQSEGDEGSSGLGAVEGAVYGLMGLLIAFTFTGAAGRFDHRRDLITREVNAIGTAWLRLDLLDETHRPKAQGLFRDYLDAELNIIGGSRSTADVRIAYQQMGPLQKSLWDLVTAASRTDNSQPLPQVLLPALNEMFDIGQERYLATLQHPPVPVYAMLGVMVLISSLFAGFGMAKARRQSPVHLIGFSAVMALSIYFILDLEFPRLGIVRVDDFDQALVDLRASME